MEKKPQKLTRSAALEMKDAEFIFRGGPPGEAYVAQAVKPHQTETMTAGWGKFDGCSIEWTVKYDEYIFVLEGTFRLRLEDGVLEATRGDIIWIPDGTRLWYEGDKAVIFWAVYPGNWAEISGHSKENA
jgi:ethanolamine utilization protein EutQ